METLFVVHFAPGFLFGSSPSSLLPAPVHGMNQFLPGRAPLPDGRAMRRLGLRLFLISLTVFFTAALFVYVITGMDRPAGEGDDPVIPTSIWGSTLLLLFSGVAIETAAQLAKRAMLERARRWLAFATLLSLGFIAVQAVAVAQLMEIHRIELTRPIIGLSGLTSVLIIIHAVHVAGGMVPLTLLVSRALRDRLSLEHIPSIRGCATYWHFLEIVWLIMLAVFSLVARPPAG